MTRRKRRRSRNSRKGPPEGQRMDIGSWNPFAPVNIEPDGRIFRKTRFDVTDGCTMDGEWMWVMVDSLQARHGVLTNDSIVEPRLVRGVRVTFRVIPDGEPLYGCAVAVAWE